MDVCGSLELNNAALSFTYLVSAALVRKVRPTALTSNTGASRLSPMSKGETRGSSTTSNDRPTSPAPGLCGGLSFPGLSETNSWPSPFSSMNSTPAFSNARRSKVLPLHGCHVVG